MRDSEIRASGDPGTVQSQSVIFHLAGSFNEHEDDDGAVGNRDAHYIGGFNPLGYPALPPIRMWSGPGMGGSGFGPSQQVGTTSTSSWPRTTGTPHGRGVPEQLRAPSARQGRVRPGEPVPSEPQHRPGLRFRCDCVDVVHAARRDRAPLHHRLGRERLVDRLATRSPTDGSGEGKGESSPLHDLSPASPRGGGRNTVRTRTQQVRRYGSTLGTGGASPDSAGPAIGSFERELAGEPSDRCFQDGLALMLADSRVRSRKSWREGA
jgi:hypothetical protein